MSSAPDPRRGPPRRAADDDDLPTRKSVALMVAPVAVLLGAIAGFLAHREPPPVAIRYSQPVEIFRLRGCRCAFPWAASLRRQGFKVYVHEQDSLDAGRVMLHVPARFSGCHIGVYRRYFLEGHVGAPAVARLTADPPWGIGLATENAVKGNSNVSAPEDELSNVLMIGPDGRAVPWWPETSSPSAPLRAPPAQPRDQTA